MTEPTEDDIRAACRFSKNRGRQIRKHHAEQAKRPAGDPTLSERDAVTAEAIRLLNAHPAVLLAWKQSAGKMRGASGKSYTVAPSGLPDILFLLKDGKGFGALEAKRPDVKAEFSPAQIRMAFLLATNGYITGVITKADEAVKVVDAHTASHGGASGAATPVLTQDSTPLPQSIPGLPGGPA